MMQKGFSRLWFCVFSGFCLPTDLPQNFLNVFFHFLVAELPQFL